MFSCNDSTQLYTSTQTAQLIGVKPQTLRVWRLHGKGPRYIRLGDSSKARVGYFESDILDWLVNGIQYPRDPGCRPRFVVNE